MLTRHIGAAVVALAWLISLDAVAESVKGPAISAVWGNDGGDKITRDELRASTGKRPVLNSLWDGQRIRVFGARNEVLSFNLVIEAAERSAEQVTVEFDRVTGPDGAIIQSRRVGKDNLFEWVDRQIELFFVKYLRIEGLSTISYETYDERHIPTRFRRPNGWGGNPRGGWKDRPDHDKDYPDIAVPLELVPKFNIVAGTNQSIWVDLYIPKDIPSGLYSGSVAISESGVHVRKIPVEVDVRDFELPDVPTARTMLFVSHDNIGMRYTGLKYPHRGSPEDLRTRKVLGGHMLLAHRHKIALIGTDEAAGKSNKPSPEWAGALRGELFTGANGYDGPGVMTGTGVYSIGTYGSWQADWGTPSEPSIWARTDRWEAWFRAHSPTTERFLYLADESSDHAAIERWAGWMRRNPGPGRELPSLATVDLVAAARSMPSLDLVASSITVGDRESWQSAADRLGADSRKRLILYNGQRPASGSFATEDDGVALRQLPWGQYKKKIARWFFWEGTYYNDYQGGRGETNVFRTAQTFGGPPRPHESYGQAGWNFGNGNGVLFYPGTDRLFPDDSHGIDGPIASLRLKHWRRGIQDVDYLALAQAIAPDAVERLIARMVPKVLWEYGVSDPKDPSWVRAPVSWDSNPDEWERAREELADIITSGRNAARDRAMRKTP